MCNIEEDEFPIQRSPRVKDDKNGRTCMKCSKAQAVVLVRLNDPLCRACFMNYFTHKFRATIGKARVIRNEDKVLLGVSGGPSSLAMLRLVSEGVSENAAKRLRFRPGVVFIDEGVLLGIADSERRKIKQDIKEFVSKNGGFDLHIVNLEDLYRLDSKTRVQESSTSPSAKLKECFDSLSSLTAKEDLLRSLRHQLLIKVAQKEGYPKIMLGDCSSRISVRILSDISQGRGEALPFDTGFVDSRHGNITVLRPMREFVAKEISLYNFFQGIEAFSIPTLATKSDCYASIDRLSEEFIEGLQAQFPFTVNTVFRTGDKITPKESYHSDCHCSLCGLPLAQDEDNLSKKFEEVQLVENYKETAKEDGETSAKNCCSGRPENCVPKMSSHAEILKTLCYGCSLTLKDLKAGFEVLPPFITEATTKKLNQEEIKEQIGEFLLQD